MKITDATKDDVRLMAQVVNMLHAASFTLSGKDVCAGADAIRWLQQSAVAVSESYTATLNPAPTTDAPFTIKAHQPGKKK